MKFILVKILTIIHILESSRGLDLSHYHHLDQAEPQKQPVIPILKYESQQDQKSWKYSYETGNGIQAEEAGFVKNFGDEKHESVVQQGSVTYRDEHGHPIKLTYIADEHGFRAEGEHLPTAPPIPEAILKAIEEEQQEEQVHPDPVQENPEENEEKVEYGQETRVYSQAQSYSDSSHGLKQSSRPIQSQQGALHRKSYLQSTNKYPQSNGVYKRNHRH